MANPETTQGPPEPKWFHGHLSVLAYLLTWLVQRPARTATVAVLVGLLWLAVLTS